MARFSDIIGQDMIKEHLQGALSTGKTSHAYIIHGEKNSGKEFIANLFAMALQCEQQGSEPCGENRAGTVRRRGLCRGCRTAQRAGL